MKNRLICLALCMVFILSAVLTGCAKKDDEEAKGEISEATSESARTLTMWLVTEKAMNAETASAVNDALNAITKTRFKTKLVVKFFTEDEYKSVLDETIRKKEDSKNELLDSGKPAETKAPAVSGSDTQTAAPDETETNEQGFAVIKYPALQENQVDIVYIAGKDMYVEYINNEWLQMLDSELSASSKKIKEYISTTLLNAAKYGGGTYAIPNNHAIGEYTFMLLDKELMEECSMDGIYNQGKITGFFNDYLFNYLETVRNHYGDRIVPIDATYEECLNLLAHYWSINPDTYEAEKDVFSFLGYRYTNPEDLSRGQTILSFNSLFADEIFCKNYLKLNEYRLDNGYFGTAVEGKKTAVSFCTGDLSTYEALKDKYYPVIVKYPTVDANEVYDHMFGVCTYSVDLARSMEIVTYLNTNSDFRNILQYGVEGVHYQMTEDENGVRRPERLNDDYVMDLFKTGNTFIAYPDPVKHLSTDAWEVGKLQNRQANIEPLLNFDFADVVYGSADDEESRPKLDSKGYAYSFKTGYSKDLLSENKLLAQWLADSDAAGKGVYVLHTCEVSGQNVTAKIYYYNNNITNAKVEVTDADGAVKVGYTGTAGNGYEITVISFYGKKNASRLGWEAAVNGTPAAANVKYQNSLLTFDFLHTNHYSVDARAKVSKSMICENDILNGWLKTNKKATKPCVGQSVRSYGEGENEKKVYTYLYYAPTAEKKYDVKFDASIDGTALNVNIDYVNSAKAAGATDLKYAMILVSVTVDKTVEAVNFNLKVDGKAPTDVNNVPFTDKAGNPADPRFAFAGELDTELVRYLYDLNEEVKKILDACTTVEEMEDVLHDLQILFTPMTKQPFDYEAMYGVTADMKTKQVQDLVKVFLNDEVERFYWNLYCAVSKTEVKHMMENDQGKLEEITDNYKSGEAYEYFQSPYMVYFDWLKQNGFAK